MQSSILTGLESLDVAVGLELAISLWLLLFHEHLKFLAVTGTLAMTGKSAQGLKRSPRFCRSPLKR
jgi:hypothetical protein